MRELDKSSGPMRPVLIYALAASLWVLLTDWLLLRFAPDRIWLQSYKGVAFVVATSILLFAVLRARAAKQEQTLRALRESEERYRMLAETSHDIILLLDLEGNICYINRAGLQLSGLSVDELLGKSILDLVHPDDVPGVISCREARAAGDRTTFVYELVLVNRRGQHVHAEVTSTPVEHGGETCILAVARDITRRKQAEEALRRSEQLFRTLAEIAPVGIFHTNAQGETIYVNERWCQMTGRDTVSAMGRGWENAIHPDDREYVFKEWYESVQKGSRFHATYRYQRPDGSYLWVMGQAVAEWGPDGQILGYIGTVTDITPLKHAQEAEQEQRTLAEALIEVAAKLNSSLNLQQVLEHILSGVEHIAPHDSANVMLIESGVARVVSRRGRQVEGKDVLQHTIAETPSLRHMVEVRQSLVIPDTRNSPLWIDSIPWIRSYAGAPICLDDKVIGFINLDGATPGMFNAEHARRLQAFANQAAIAIQNARLYQELETYSSFLEEAIKQRTAELRQVTERVQAILNHSPDPILLLKPDGTIDTANPTFYQLFGYPVDALRGQLPLDLFAPEGADAMREALRRATEEGVMVRTEMVARRLDGGSFDVEVALAPIREDDKPVGIVCTIRDISMLKEVARLKDTFVSNVSHELRTPITSLKLNHDLMRRNPEQSALYLERLGREINRLNALIEDLLQLSRLDQGRVAINLRAVDLNALAAQYAEDRVLLAESRQLTLSLQTQPDLPTAQADEGLIGQVLSILLTNALSYTPAGGHVTISTHLREADGKRWVGFSVRDTGPGISADERDSLFERFFRGQAGRSSGVPGTGLGLAIAREIVQRHQGRIEVDSEGVPGRGATFTVWLPTEE